MKTVPFLVQQQVRWIELIKLSKSIHRQLIKKTAMTDRQFALVKQKLLTYGRLWQDNDIDINKYVDVLKYPLREIDRSHWIKILRYKEEDVLGIRFPLNKKVIDRVEELRRLNGILELMPYIKIMYIA